MNGWGENLVWREHDRKVAPYLWAQRVLGWAGTAMGLVVVYALCVKGQGQEISSLAGTWAPNNRFLHWLGFFAVVGVVWEAIRFPFSLAGQWLEKQYRLSKQSYGSWLGDHLKGWLLGGILGTVALALLYWSQVLWPEGWWLLAATGMMVFSILLVQLAPVVLIPLFFPLRPLDGGPLKERLLELCRREGVDVKEVYHLGMGAKTEKGNAAFTGLGRTKRILIGDTLYENYPQEQVEAVFAHELGHQIHNDLWKGIGLGAGVTFFSFYLADVLTTRWAAPYWSTDLGDPFGMLLFFVVYSLIQIPLGWLQAAWSRYRERLADRYAAETIGVPAPLAEALERLTYQNHGQFYPSPFREKLSYSHPAPWRRIVGLRNAAENGRLAMP